MLVRETSQRNRKGFNTTNPKSTPYTMSLKYTIQRLTQPSGILKIVLNARTQSLFKLFFCGYF